MDAPRSITLKTGLPERTGAGWNAGRHEVRFYKEIAAAMSARLVPECFDAAWDADTNAWHLLLEDLTDSHFTLGNWPLPPTLAECERINRYGRSCERLSWQPYREIASPAESPPLVAGRRLATGHTPVDLFRPPL
jgi:hypothetical protein